MNWENRFRCDCYNRCQFLASKSNFNEAFLLGALISFFSIANVSDVVLSSAIIAATGWKPRLFESEVACSAAWAQTSASELNFYQQNEWNIHLHKSKKYRCFWLPATLDATKSRYTSNRAAWFNKGVIEWWFRDIFYRGFTRFIVTMTKQIQIV